MSQPSTLNTASGRTSLQRSDVRSADSATDPDGVSQRVPYVEIERAIRDVRFGSVTLIIQDGIVLQIDKTEKLRLR